MQTYRQYYLARKMTKISPNPPAEGDYYIAKKTSPKYEKDIILLLAKSPGRIFGKEMLYDLVWNEPYSGDYNVVMRHFCNIREKIEDDSGKPLYIQTVRGVGYRFNGNLGSE